MRLFAEDRAGALLRTPTINDLFNELHRRLYAECESKPLNDTVPMQRITLEIDALHHDYMEITS